MGDAGRGGPPAEGVRLQKVLAAAGVASRRGSEALIQEGRVEVNGRVVSVLGTRVDPARDHIRVDGRRLPPARHHLYLLLNKPRGVVSTLSDPAGRLTLSDYVPPRSGRLFHVGRLDTDTEGLIVLTNDGDLAQRLTHPRYEVAKTYLAQVDGLVDRAVLRRLAEGVVLEDGLVRPDKVRLTGTTANRSLVEIRLHSGRNRVVRRLFEAVGHPVSRLARTRIGPIGRRGLPVGQTRPLTGDELGALFDAAGL
ncbi:MAG: rRNA pseudouridine synthase [Propionibacteriaceae bacterium]|jgi:23S rRNA pseudouridine2605 synthase|nr:rRNA pseudouridine synthase [Propionibacteriaceae bacterium]